ncbi:MAG: co-chaperone GroES [Methanosarcinales archaeon]
MKIKPVGDKILIKPIEEEERTASGIYIPDTAKEKKKQGIILEIGNIKDEKKCPIKVGDTVLYTGYSSDEIEIDGEIFIILSIKDVIAKVE